MSPTLEKAGVSRYIVRDKADVMTFIGIVSRERYRSRRTYSVGWRWFYSCRCHGNAVDRERARPREPLESIFGRRPDVGLEGYNTRKFALDRLMKHVKESP